MSVVIAHTMPYLNFADVLQKQSTTLHKLNCYTKTKKRKKLHKNMNITRISTGLQVHLVIKAYATKKFPHSLGRG